MDWIIVLEFELLVVLFTLSGFFSSTETAMFSLTSTQLEQMRTEKHPRLDLIERLLREPRRLIITILIGNEFVNVATTAISTTLVIHYFGAENAYYNLFFMVPALLVFGEITPKTLAINNNIRFASFEAPLVSIFAKATKPVRLVIRSISEFIITLIIGDARSQSNLITEDMVRVLANAAVDEGALDHNEAEYIHQIFDLGNKTVGDIMTLRSDIMAMSIDTPYAEMIAAQLGKKHSRIPIFDEDLDHIIGILHLRNLISIAAEGASQEEIHNRLKKPLYVPENKAALNMLHAFRERKQSIAIVVDEYGGVTGLITMTDLLECIFGDIRDEREQFMEPERIRDNLYMLSGSMLLQDFDQHFAASFSATDAETLAGLLLHEYGELPETGTAIDIDAYHFVIVGKDRNRISKVSVEIRPDKSETENKTIIEDGKSSTREDR